MAMAKFIIIMSTCLLYFAISGAAVVEQQYLLTQCGYTRFPQLCADHALSSGELFSEDNSTPTNLMSFLIKKTISENILPVSNFEALSYHFISKEAQDTRTAIGECRELLSMSTKRLNQALEAIKQSPENHKTDIQTWLSAALTYHQTCKDIADTHAASNFYMAEISKKMDYLSQLGSNPLALVNRIVAGSHKNTATATTVKGRGLAEEQQQFPSWVSAKDRKLLQSTTINANVVVAKDGSGDYTTISEAIQAARGGRFVIYVKSGVYNEKIHCNKDGITLVGDGKYSTVISGSSSVGGGSSLQGSATVTISGDGFIAKDIGFQNNAGAGADQAIALLLASDHAVLYRCSLVGYQDTLYALSLRQFYRECDIYGTVDFIFGNAAAVFQNCYLVLRRPRSHGAFNVILANGRTDPGQNTGFSLQSCKITVGSDFSPVKNSFDSYLGRPWKEFSRAVVMQSNIDGEITPKGWAEWPGESGYAKTLYFAEFENMGPGAGTGGRVSWPGHHVLANAEASKFTVANFISGNSWIPSTGVSFVSGLS
ncbi:OLC1v1035058C1 [Oldenlandia corymbosa var. corymbosa]|uniref:Pectinesterase n=1 Tax=Oldenlandia corymbosa var. corymbosa TaxID=529605 RepID=A0AAV1CS26_OLDCO|nr:OLC1v1035058C1 [Oldenlandia corymbosa var. corymbosa]